MFQTLIKISFRGSFPTLFPALLPACSTPTQLLQGHYKYLLRAMKTWQWESWKLKLVREKQIYDYCPSAFGECAAGRKTTRHDTKNRARLTRQPTSIRTSPSELRLCFVFIILMVEILNKPNFMTIWLCIFSCSNDSIGWNSWCLYFRRYMFASTPYMWCYHNNCISLIVWIRAPRSQCTCTQGHGCQSDNEV